MEEIQKLRINKHISILIIGETTTKEQFLSLWNQNSNSIKHAGLGRLFNNLCYVTEHKIDDKKIYCNMWNYLVNTNKRMFFANKIDYCIILCNLHNENATQISEYLSLKSTLCPNTDYCVIGMMQKPEDEVRPNIRKNIIDVLEYGEIQEFPRYETVTEKKKVSDIILSIIHEIYTTRVESLNLKFKELIKQL